MELATAIILACCALGAGIAVGFAVGKSCEAIGRQPESASAVRSNMIMGCAIAETTGIYGLVIAILLIFVAPNMFINLLKSVL